MENLLPSIGLYVFLINVLSFIIIGYDKKKAKIGGWRVPEKKLLLIACIGGAAGVYLGMMHFRHKTKHSLFLYGVPLLILLNMVTLYFALKVFV